MGASYADGSGSGWSKTGGAEIGSSTALSEAENGDGGGDASPKPGACTSGAIKLGGSGAGVVSMGGISMISGSCSAAASPPRAACISSSETYIVFSGSFCGRSRTSSGSAIGSEPMVWLAAGSS